MMGQNVIILRSMHRFDRTDIPIHKQGYTEKSILEVCDGVWFGRNSIILPSCIRIGKDAIIGAGSIVTKSVPDYAIVGGSPARIRRMRKLTHDSVGEAKLTLPSGITLFVCF